MIPEASPFAAPSAIGDTTMAHRGEVVTDNQEERRKNAGGYEGRHGPPPPPDSPEAAIARSEGGSSTHSAITPGASGNSDTKGAMDGAEQFDEEDTEADDESEEATSND